jgi:tetratricopeptide (TPR) repeat protein
MSVWYIGVQVVHRVGVRRGLFGALFLAALLAGPLTFAVSPAFEQGESLFLLDRPLDAQPLLERAILDEPANEAAYLYLGLAYEQVQEHEKAVQVLQRGAALGGERQGQIYFNIGNNLFADQSYLLASEMYAQALSADPTIRGAYLNRANSLLQSQEFDAALGDYVLYLRLEPGSTQRTQVEQIIALLRQRITLVADQQRVEQDRQTALLNAVLSSLDNAAQNTKNLSAGSESIREEYDQLDIAD